MLKDLSKFLISLHDLFFSRYVTTATFVQAPFPFKFIEAKMLLYASSKALKLRGDCIHLHLLSLSHPTGSAVRNV